MIDEVTHYSAAELFLLNEISRKSYEDESLSFMKIIAAGDPTQMGKMVKLSSQYYNYNIDSVTGISRFFASSCFSLLIPKTFSNSFHKSFSSGFSFQLPILIG